MTEQRNAFCAEGARGAATAPSGDGAIGNAFCAERARGRATAPSGDGAIRGAFQDRLLPLAFAMGMGAVLAAIVLAAASPGSTGAVAARGAFAPFCHQDPARSFAWAGEAFCICHRCFGIYAGLFVGALLSAIAPRLPVDIGSRNIWLFVLAPMGLHVALLNVWPPADLVALRVGTGALFGLWGGYAATRALASMLAPAPPAPAVAPRWINAEPLEAGRSEA